MRYETDVLSQGGPDAYLSKKYKDEAGHHAVVFIFLFGKPSLLYCLFLLKDWRQGFSTLLDGLMPFALRMDRRRLNIESLNQHSFEVRQKGVKPVRMHSFVFVPVCGRRLPIAPTRRVQG